MGKYLRIYGVTLVVCQLTTSIRWVGMDIDRQEQKKDELVYDTLKSEYADEVKKSDRIDEEARGTSPKFS